MSPARNVAPARDRRRDGHGLDGEGLRSGDLASETTPEGAGRSTFAITPRPRPHVRCHSAGTVGSLPARDRVRCRGPFVALLVRAITAGLSAIVLEIPATGHTSNMLGIVGSVLALLAVPTAVAFGIPVEVGPVRAGLAIATSLVLWALLGWWASRRVSQRVIGGWREWLIEFGWVTFCLWAGVLTGVGVLLHLAS